MLRPLIFAASLLASTSAVATDSSYEATIQQQRVEREAGLRKPGGWLSLIGLDWLSEGRNTIGSARDNDIVLAKGPPKLGVITLADGKAQLSLVPGTDATVDGKSVTTAQLVADADGTPSVVAVGPVSFVVIKRNDKIGLRVKDADGDALKHFLGIDFYAIKPEWRIQARWVAFDTPQALEIPDVVGTIYKLKVPGKAVFERDGQTHELLPMNEDLSDGLFFVFADQTSGKFTYGGGRFLNSAVPENGNVLLDFNLAYNPPCAFTPYATCPLAPPENRLKLAIDAGEKKYEGSTH